jgi:putative inorganic carbon (HCO3(-)) transporter
MRDVVVTLVVFGLLPSIFKKPYIGAIMWVWISVMNPHTQGWGFATTFPFAALIAGVTMISLLVSKEPKSLPLTPVTGVFIAFILWMNVTTILGFYPEESFEQWNKVMKIMLMTLVVLMLIKTEKHVKLLISIIVLSLAYYGFKGGIFTIIGGGVHMVLGPEGTFIGGNNEIALALIMTIPLIHYVQTLTQNLWVRHGLTVVMLLSTLAALGSYSRGALVAIATMGTFLWLKSRHKVRIGLLLLLAIPPAIAFMPEKWTERMDTINEYEEDLSVQGRFNAWWMAYNLATDRPLGGGFEIITPDLFHRYAPNPLDIHAAHSIYFQALGEHGFVGLGLYLLLGFLVWRTGSWIIRNTSNREDYRWASDLATMVQVSLVGFSVGGAFLSLLYFDVPYYLMCAMVATRIVVEKGLKEVPASIKGNRIADSALQTRVPQQVGSFSPSPSHPATRDSG